MQSSQCTNLSARTGGETSSPGHFLRGRSYMFFARAKVKFCLIILYHIVFVKSIVCQIFFIRFPNICSPQVYIILLLLIEHLFEAQMSSFHSCQILMARPGCQIVTAVKLCVAAANELQRAAIVKF